MPVPLSHARPATSAGLFPPEQNPSSVFQWIWRYLQQSPLAFGAKQTRWTLALLHEYCPPFWALTTVQGIWQRLRRLKLSYKRGRQHLHSPDPDYDQKLAAVLKVLKQARETPGQVVLLYSDEKTVYRQPQAASAWYQEGSGGNRQPLAELSCRSNTKWRLAGAVNAVSGQLVWHSASKMGPDNLNRLLDKIARTYPGKRVVVAWDNWPIHKNERLLKRARELGIELLSLPTYAPWTNPIEKLWRWLSQEILQMHRHSDEWERLKQRTHDFLDRFATPSPELLRYIGFSRPEKTC